MRLSWQLAPVSVRPSGCRGHPRRGGVWRPVCPGPSGSATSPRPPFRRQTGAVEGGPRPAERTGILKLLQQHKMERGPNPSSMPRAQPAPTRLAAAAHLGTWQVLPLHARAQHLDDARQRRPIRSAWSAALRLIRLGAAAAAGSPPNGRRRNKSSPCSLNPPAPVLSRTLSVMKLPQGRLPPVEGGVIDPNVLLCRLPN